MKHSDLLRALGGAKSVGDALRAKGVIVADVTVRSWLLVGRTIPAKYWSHIVSIANEAGHGASLESLAEAVAASTGTEPASSEAA